MLEAGHQARDQGLNIRKVWTLGDDPCEFCQAVAAEYGDEDLDDPFESEDNEVDAPPLHPNCNCELDRGRER
jgi:hypothetical protein